MLPSVRALWVVLVLCMEIVQMSSLGLQHNVKVVLAGCRGPIYAALAADCCMCVAPGICQERHSHTLSECCSWHKEAFRVLSTVPHTTCSLVPVHDEIGWACHQCQSVTKQLRPHLGRDDGRLRVVVYNLVRQQRQEVDVRILDGPLQVKAPAVKQ